MTLLKTVIRASVIIGTFDGLKLAAAIGTPRIVKVTNQSPPRRSKNDPGPRSAHEYKLSSFKDEYSFTCKSPDFNFKFASI